MQDNQRWRYCTLGEAIVLQRGFDLPERERRPGNVPVVSSSGITGVHNVAKVQGPGVVTGRYGTLGEVFYVKEDFWPLNTTLFIRDFKGNDPVFISYFLKILNLAHQSTAGAVPGLNRNALHLLPIYLPPLPAQHKIAAILSAYDDLIENNTRRIAILEEIAQSIYQEWFVRFRYPGYETDKMVESELGMIPEGWEAKSLGDLCHITMGQSPSSQFYNENGDGLPFHQGVTNFGEYFPIDHIYCSVENRIAEAGDILFSVRAPVGRINVSNKKIVIGRGLSAIRSKFGNQTFILYQLKECFQKEDTIGNGAIFKSVTKDDMYNIKLLLPSNDIVSLFEEYTQTILKNIEVLTRKNINLRNTRDLLLPKLISGEIDVESLDIDIPDLTEPEAQQHEPIIARPEPIDATQLALPLS